MNYHFINVCLHVNMKETQCILDCHHLSMNFLKQGGSHVTRNDKTRITVDIYNQTYTIIGDESEAHVRLVASLVDQKMREIKEKNVNLDTSRLAVLTAVNTMNDYLKLKEDYEVLESLLNEKEDK